MDDAAKRLRCKRHKPDQFHHYYYSYYCNFVPEIEIMIDNGSLGAKREMNN